MDFQNRAGGKTGSGGVASASESNRDRRERLRQLALETIDLNKVPYLVVVTYICKLQKDGPYHMQGSTYFRDFDLGAILSQICQKQPSLFIYHRTELTHEQGCS